MAKEKKLTVKHFYGEDLKTIGSNPDKLFPLYIQLTYNRKNTRIRSFSLNAAFEIAEFRFKRNPNNYENTLESLLDPKRLQYYIDHDIKIIAVLKKLFEDNFTQDFDLSFFTSDICKKLVVPIDFYIDSKLHELTFDYFLSKKNNAGVINLLIPYELGFIVRFLKAVEEINGKLFNDLFNKKLIKFYSRLFDFLFIQRFEPDVFYFVFDIYNDENLNSLLTIAKRNLEETDFEDFRKLLNEQLLGKIYQIFSEQ